VLTTLVSARHTQAEQLSAVGRQEHCLNLNVIHPTYADSFQCIGPACEDNCCQGWVIPVDQATAERFRNLPPSAVRTLIDANILLTPQSDDGSKPPTFAQFRMTESNKCPLLSEDRLCRIQTDCGEQMLPHACATYPRIVCLGGNIEEKALTLSCPEAARLVLLNPALLGPRYPAIRAAYRASFVSTEQPNDAGAIHSWFWPIRDVSLGLVTNRVFPIWQRLFLLGAFCRGLDSIAKGELHHTVPSFLNDFETAVSSTLPAAMNALPTDLGQQLDVVLRMAGMLLQSSAVRPRFAECVEAFKAGIGNRPDATFASLTARYGVAYDRYYEPFFERQPHILENYLVNTVIRCQFPFGRESMRTGAAPVMAREHGSLIAQFALMKGFLIGVAGFHGDGFSDAHVVHTVQSVSKHFEHHLDFLDRARALLVECRMDDNGGSAILLRNDRTPRPAGTSSTVIPPVRPAATSRPVS
jgi:lysine-N-methylase